jgi:tetratricopeptide (TPR) repeat protein
LIRCGDCGVEGQDASRFRPYYPSINGPPIHYCSTCWDRRERDTQREGLKVTAGLIVVVALAALVFELGSGSELARVCLLVLVFEVAGTVLHELGHAGVALGLGLRLHTISFGYGQVLYSRRVGSAILELRSVPVCGFVMVAGRSRTFARLRQALVCLAGPSTNAALAFVAWQAGIRSFPAESLAIGDVTAWHIMFAVNASIVVLNLFPFAFPASDDYAGKWQPNDGLLTLQTLAASQDAVDGWANVAVRWEVLALLDRNDVDAAREIVEAELQNRPESVALRLLLGRIHLARQEWEAATQILEGLVERVGAADGEESAEAREWRSECLAALARASLGRGDPERAETEAREALKLDPTSVNARFAHGQALLARGFVAKAEAAFVGVLAVCERAPMRALATCGVALARLQAGDSEGCQEQLERARSLDPGCAQIAVVEQALGAKGLDQRTE